MTTSERFMRFVNIQEDGCWIWTGTASRGGYGMFHMGKMVSAHRASWMLFRGEIHASEGYHGSCVCHTCDVKKCVNPEHLFIGTHADNIEDARFKGRMASGSKVAERITGERAPWAKLTESAVKEIRSRFGSGDSAMKLASEFGISRITVYDVCKRRSWSHL